jgi:thiol-disulfide isomerase/thioredoxin
MLHRILGAALLVLVGVLLAYKFAAPPPRSLGTTSADSSLLKPLQEDLVRHEITEGPQKITLVNFWASWCVPCRKEFPELVALRKELAQQGLKVLLISADEEEQRGAVESFLKEQKVDFPTYFKGSANIATFDHLYPRWNGALPANVIYDSKGQVLEAWFGETTRPQFEEMIKKHL